MSCAKIRYRDRIAALLVLTRTDNRARLKAERRAYRCPSCRGWHLTSKSRAGAR